MFMSRSPVARLERVREVFRPWFGRALCVGIGIICIVAAVGLLVA